MSARKVTLLLAGLTLLGSFAFAVEAAPQPRLLPQPGTISLEQVASGLAAPVLATHAGDGSGRLFIVEQRGTIRVLSGGSLQPGNWLDIQGKVLSGGERGLLGLAFYPDFETSGRLIVSYTRRPDGYSVLERITVTGGVPNPNGQVLLVQFQPFSNHNGGGIAFGPDGYLYFGLGDGGSGCDPMNNAQNLNSLLGKMLRIDVSGAGGYTIPPTNPYAGGGGLGEIWASGLRNPWRWSFDKASGDLWIGDVGQNAWEEVDFQPRASRGGENYGWKQWEGNHESCGAINPPREGRTFPIHEYSHGQGCSITGGYVYRGTQSTSLQGKYIFSDYCSGTLWTGTRTNVLGTCLESLGLPVNPLPCNFTVIPAGNAPGNPSSFGEDEAGEVYVVIHGGSVHHIKGSP